MKRWIKIGLAVGLVFSVAMAGTVTLAAASIYRDVQHGLESGDFREHGFGGIHVKVWDKDSNERIGFRFPGWVLRMALHFAPLEFDADDQAQLRAQLPVLRAIADNMERGPDVTYVSVDSKDESIRIGKLGSKLVVHVNSDSEEVLLEMPVSCVMAMANAIDRAATKQARHKHHDRLAGEEQVAASVDQEPAGTR